MHRNAFSEAAVCKAGEKSWIQTSVCRIIAVAKVSTLKVYRCALHKTVEYLRVARIIFCICSAHSLSYTLIEPVRASESFIFYMASEEGIREDAPIRFDPYARFSKRVLSSHSADIPKVS